MTTRALVITSGGFDPIHEGHIEYLQRAKQLYDNVTLVCIVNTDDFLKKKKGYAFQPLEVRFTILSELKSVDYVVPSIDKDMTVCETIEAVYNFFTDRNRIEYGFDIIVFAKGGDRTKDEIPEKVICDKLGIVIKDGLGDKISSSSELVKRVREIESKKVLK